MHLSDHEQEKLLIYVASQVAKERRARGLKLNYPEAVALISAHVLEGIRDGKTVPELQSKERKCFHVSDVMEGVPEMLKPAPGRGYLPRRHEARDPSVPIR